VPTPSVFAALRERRPPPYLDFRARVGELVLVVSSSRGGSSVFTEMLRHVPELNALRAEVNPFLRLAGAEGPDDDGLDAGAAFDGATLDAELALDAGRWSGLDERGVEAFGLDLTWRLAAQWPEERFDPEHVVRWTRAALPIDDLVGFHLRVLASVRRQHPAVDPWYYDIAPERVAAAFPELPRPSGPPSGSVLEEPPFVLVQPWHVATPSELAERPLVVKTPSNAYRLDWWRAAFPAARLRILHLVRNPAASINGLYDGWRYRGFHAHQVGGLDIDGYSHLPGGRTWWKYDRPPGWRAYRAARLEEVCAFQWRSAHRHALDWLAAHPEVDRLRVRFEDVVGEPDVRREALDRLGGWLGLAPGGALQRIGDAGLPPIMATDAPRQRRWFARAEMLGPVLDDNVRGLACDLGYNGQDHWT